ncbi:hypothetical protein BP6252_12855 [Coleophoma cylindrospora]|uniref:Calpain catalytic domain-containing protein n=1 Tax=Coleophoma cylindrospora TaxID=1849047 RepID=A0A3D8QDR8_9HELO|nr:hypothetical protein BP6252_12855 [Coleophoma cylindrospora]
MSVQYTSSDSDLDQRRGPPPPAPPPKTKKKKKALPPQESINKIWSKFSAARFSKATVVLPTTTATKNDSSALKTPASSPPNRLVSEDFGRAVSECRARVQKLVKECRRVNMRYRDPDFDIDWDLKWAKGHCLNGLDDTKFFITGPSFKNPPTSAPKAVKRVHEIFEKPTFIKSKISPADVKQGLLGDCWLMASLTALANMEVGIHRICVEYDTKVGIYGFVFHRDGQWIISIIDDKLYLKSPDWDSPSHQRILLEQIDREDVEKEYRKTYQTGSQALFFAHCRDQNETWLPLLEKAYAKAHGDYGSLQGGWIGEGVEDLTGGVTTELLTSDILDTDEFWNKEILQVNKEFLFGCSTGLLDGGYGSRDGISEGHAYVIMEARELSNGTRLLKLRNPWGKIKKGNWEGPWSDGSKEFTPEAQQELNHKFGNDSVFWISYEDLLRKYQHFDRTRLFMDSADWRLTQKWISVDVPWKAEFEQKFRIVLKKESPIVLMLSQLDDRYFQGLEGQYSYRLQFRLHEIDSPSANDYIVRSHGNYLMSRSVVTELSSLPAGTYSVFIMVVADRNSSLPSVEDVVRKQCCNKDDNEKLAQVGVSYNLAHNKAAAYMEAVAAARAAQDKARARKSRIALRRKNWEIKHMGRDVMKKQDKKNRQKREEKVARDEAEEKERKEREDKEAQEAKERLPKDQGVQTEDLEKAVAPKEDKGVQTDLAVKDEQRASPLPPLNDTEKGIQTDSMSASATDLGTPETPNFSVPSPPSLRMMIPCPDHQNRHHSMPQSSGDTQRPHYGKDTSSHRYPHHGAPPPQPYLTSDGESSASPISDFDNMYSDDDPTLKPRTSHGNSGNSPHGSKTKNRDSDDEDEVDPWNAICIVGFKVYSKDEGLELKVLTDGIEDSEVEAAGKADDEGTDADTEDAAEEPDAKKSKNKDEKQIVETSDEAKMKAAEENTQAAEMEILTRPKTQAQCLVPTVPLRLKEEAAVETIHQEYSGGGNFSLCVRYEGTSTVDVEVLR